MARWPAGKKPFRQLQIQQCLTKTRLALEAQPGQLGRSALDIFGWHPERPSDRYDCMGLVWTVSLITRPLGNPKLVALWQAMAKWQWHWRFGARDIDDDCGWDFAVAADGHGPQRDFRASDECLPGDVLGEGELMLPHELLRTAATIVVAGWAAGCDAQGTGWRFGARDDRHDRGPPRDATRLVRQHRL